MFANCETNGVDDATRPIADAPHQACLNVLRKKREDALAFLDSIEVRKQTLLSEAKARGRKRTRLTRSEKRQRREERERAADELLGPKRGE